VAFSLFTSVALILALRKRTVPEQEAVATAQASSAGLLSH